MADQKYEGVINAVYNKINELFGAGDQLFSMEFPARPLNFHRFEYDTDERNSVISKPFSVEEAEFRISDDLFNVAPINQGPNGEKLTVVYETLLNNYVPKLKDLKDFVVDKVKIRQWLLERIEDEINGEKLYCSRMEFCQMLYSKYLEEKNRWNKEKDNQYNSYKSKNDLDGFAKWVSTEGMVRDEMLNNFFNDAVVRGNYHEILTFLGFLNIASTAEQLESSKQSIRNSARQSLDASMKVFPVQFQPSNWFKSLKPNFSPKDLTMSKEIIQTQLQQKQKEVRLIKSKLAEYDLYSIDPSEVEKMEADLQVGKQQFQQAEANLIKSYGDGALMAFKVYLNAQTGGVLSAIKSIKSENFDKTTADALGLGQEVVDSMLKTYSANADFISKAQQLSDMKARIAEGRTHDYRAEKVRLQERIQELEADIKYLGGLFSGIVFQGKEDGADPGEPSLLPQNKEEGSSDLNFMDVVISSEDVEDSSSSSSSSSASHKSWHVSGWFFSAGGTKESSSSMSQQESKAMSKKFDIGFRATKVTMDRGGWFNPTIFKMSNAFYHLADMRAGAGITKEKVKQAMDSSNNNINRIDDLVKYGPNKASYMMPAYPIAFVIAKDITIKVELSEQEMSEMQQYMDKSSSSGGGFLCFSCSSSSSSKSTMETSYHGSHNNNFYIRIPGPQILGWFLQFTPEDLSTPYESLDNEGIKLQLENELKEYTQPKEVKPVAAEVTVN